MPEEELESKTNLDHLRGAFGGLSEAHHEILVMRELEGLSYREIGDRLGMTRPSVESTLFRARRRLTEEYEELVSGARCQRIQVIIADSASTDLGMRDQRRLARHVSHCQPCRRQARLAGLEIASVSEQPIRARIAAFLPLPLFLRRRWLGHNDVDASGAISSHASGLAQWSAQFGSTMDPSWLKAAATAATLAVAGVGASAVTHTITTPTATGGIDRVVSGLAGGSGDSSSAPVTSAGGVTAPVTRRAVTHRASRHAAGAVRHDAAGSQASGATNASAAAPPSADAVGQATSGATAVADSTQKATAGTPIPDSAPSSPQPPSGVSVPADATKVPTATPTVPVSAPDVSGATNDPTGTATTAVGNALGH